MHWQCPHADFHILLCCCLTSWERDWVLADLYWLGAVTAVIHVLICELLSNCRPCRHDPFTLKP